MIDVEKELRANERHMITKPTGVAQRRNRGTAINSANAKGARIYDTPCCPLLTIVSVRSLRSCTHHGTSADDSNIARVHERLMGAVVILEDPEGKSEALKNQFRSI